MQSISGQAEWRSYKSVYRSVEELKGLMSRIYGPTIRLAGASDTDFSFRTSVCRDGFLTLSDCHTSDNLDSSFSADNDDIVIITRSRGDFAIRTGDGDYALSRDVGFVFTLNHILGFTSTRSTATTAMQIGRSQFDAILQAYCEDAPSRWSGIQNFSLGGGFGHLSQALSQRYRENFASRPDCAYSAASLDLVRNAAVVAIAELVSCGTDSHRRERFTASRRNVMRAVELINSQTSPLTIHDLATSLDISVRALQDGFRKHLNASPHSLLKTGRLEGARRDLVSGKVGSVREAATKWGFSNLARFTQEYFEVLGGYPKDTLRPWQD